MARLDGLVSVCVAAAICAAAPVVRAAPAVAATPAAAPAPGWSETFVPAKVGTYLGDKKPNVMVVGATTVSEPAAEALRGAMRASKSAGLVMDAQAIGTTEGLDDRTIVERARTQPVAQVVIVRVFDGGPGEPQSAIVSFYRPDGTVATAITGTAGVAIASNGGGAASAGVSTEAVAAVEAIGDESKAETKKEEKVNAEAQAKYDAQFLYFENWIGVSAQTGAVVATWSQIKQGKYGADVRGRRLYQIVGRDDLLRKYKIRHGVRLGVGLGVSAGGLAMLTVGMVGLLSNVNGFGPYFGADDPIQMGRDRVPGPISNTAGAVLMGVGGGLFFAGMFFAVFFKSHPVNKSQAAELMDTYNKDLRKKLGLPEKTARVRVAPTFGPQSAGLAVAGRF